MATNSNTCTIEESKFYCLIVFEQFAKGAEWDAKENFVNYQAGHPNLEHKV